MMNSAVIRIHTHLIGAQAIKGIDEVLIHATWKLTANQEKKERIVLVPAECVKAPEVPDSFRALVESVLLAAAEQCLKNYVNSNPNSAEMDVGLFARDGLVAEFLTKQDNWMSKETLELGFTASKTWKRIAGRPEFKNNAVYQMQANRFKDTILKLSGKAVSLDADKCDVIMAKLEDDDLETPFGEFVVKRLTALKAKQGGEFDLSAL